MEEENRIENKEANIEKVGIVDDKKINWRCAKKKQKTRKKAIPSWRKIWAARMFAAAAAVVLGWGRKKKYN